MKYKGETVSKVVALFPIGYLSAGTCVALVLIGGSTSKTFYQIVCGPTCTHRPLTPAEWYLVFTTGAVILSQLPNLNSIAGVSLIGAITAVGYCTLIWTVSVAEGRIPGISYNPVLSGSRIHKIFNILNAVGIIAFAFRGHNLILEIQVPPYILFFPLFISNFLFFFLFVYTVNNWYIGFFNQVHVVQMGEQETDNPND